MWGAEGNLEALISIVEIIQGYFDPHTIKQDLVGKEKQPL